MDLRKILAPLNREQHAAATAAQRNWLVLAGAGCGKTRVLVHRMAWSIVTGKARPHGILAVTFTNKAAREMLQRFNGLLGGAHDNMWISTFHGIAHRLLRIHAKDAGLAGDFRICDSEEQLRIVRRVILQLRLDEEIWAPRRAQAFINARKEEGLRPRHLRQSRTAPEELVRIYEEYHGICEREARVDFAELLLRAFELLRGKADILSRYRERFPHVFVDEFQDTNALQYAWLQLLVGERGRLFAVGDDDQSIYSWRGARPEHVYRFRRDFPDGGLLRLERNYRSTGNILKAANRLIAYNESRVGHKQLWTDRGDGEQVVLYSAYNEWDESRYVAEEILSWKDRGRDYAGVAVLYRVSAQSRALEEALLRTEIPYRIYGGLRFYERQEIKHALAYLQLAVSPGENASFERVVNFPPRGIGMQTLETLRAVAGRRRCSLWQAAAHVVEEDAMSRRALGALEKFLCLIGELAARIDALPLAEAVETATRVSGLIDHYRKDEKDAFRLENLEELTAAAAAFEETRKEQMPEMSPVIGFLSHTTLDSGEEHTADSGQDHVRLMTLHAAKGLEFDKVFLVGMEEGLFPHHLCLESAEQIEEERRLCYVGMTRARRSLTLVRAERRRLHGKVRDSRASRFLSEIPVEDAVSAPAERDRRGPLPDASRLDLELGQRVLHASFGEGVVLAMDRQGFQTRVQVRFEAGGNKWLIAEVAPMSVI